MIRERRINIEADDFASLFLYEKQVFAKYSKFVLIIGEHYNIITTRILCE